MYVASESVKGFPLGKPRSGNSNDLTSRIFYESMVTNLIRQLVDVDGFLISSPGIYINPSTVNDNYKITDADLEFNLGGYWFKVNKGTVIVPTSPNDHETPLDETKGEKGEPVRNATCYVYACITLDNNDGIKEISGQDVDSKYTGLTFIASASPPSEFKKFTYQLPIFSGYVNAGGLPQADTWKIYAPSFIKFMGNSIDIDVTGIDGKPKSVNY